jgi:hypothetical protein
MAYPSVGRSHLQGVPFYGKEVAMQYAFIPILFVLLGIMPMIMKVLLGIVPMIMKG